MELLFFEDFEAGADMPPATLCVSAADAANFEAEFGALAAASPGGPEPSAALSGLHLAALGMRLICDGFIGRTASLGAPGIDTVEWPNPAYPGDRLRLEARVTSTRPSASRPEMGLVGFEFAIRKQDGECVMTQTNVIMVKRRSQDGRT